MDEILVEKKPWARLFKKRAIRRKVGNQPQQKVLFHGEEREFFDIRSNQFHFGRDPVKCEYVIGKNEGLELKWWSRISKIHFVLYKENNLDDSPVLIKDLSRNGTFLNGILIGQNQTRFLKTGDVISVIEEDIKIFDFKDLVVRERVDLPAEVKKNYFVSHKLGSGAFGEVYKVIDRKLRSYAVKYIKGDSSYSKENNQVTDNEIKIMKNLSHVCIIRTLDIMKDTSGGACLIIEYMDGGDLLNRIIGSPGRRLTENQARCVFFQVTDAINYLHNKGITHRDIKPDNVLLKNADEYPLVKLTDFGLSKWVTEGTVMKSLIGTPTYCAPEVLKTGVSKYTSKVDVWSMGVMLFAMISGTLPFADEYGDVHKQIISGKFEFLAKSWKEVSGDAMRLIRMMLVVQPEIRIKVPDIFTTSWMHPKHSGIMKAMDIMQSYGDVTRKHGKDFEFACPAPPPPKRPRLH